MSFDFHEPISASGRDINVLMAKPGILLSITRTREVGCPTSAVLDLASAIELRHRLDVLIAQLSQGDPVAQTD